MSNVSPWIQYRIAMFKIAVWAALLDTHIRYTDETENKYSLRMYDVNSFDNS